MNSILLRQIIAGLTTLIAISITGLVLTAARSGILFPFDWTAAEAPFNYGITIDAGSHGTRGHLYSWPVRIEESAHPLLSPVTIPQEVLEVNTPDTMGISEFMADPARVGPRVLRPIIDIMVRNLKQRDRQGVALQEIPIFLKATAGMRNMDADSRDSIMVSIREYLSNKTNSPFAFKPDWARVVSGEEEGVFGWITVNQMMGTLFNSASTTVGALDLGGASSQITFMPMHTSVLEDFYEMSLGATTIRLYSHSFLGYGWGDALSRVTTRLALENLFHILKQIPQVVTNITESDVAVSSGQVPRIYVVKEDSMAPSNPILAEFVAEHPCFPSGYNFTFNLPSLLYPDGRAFLDMDLRAMLAFMEAEGMDIGSDVVRRSFPNAIIEQVKRSSLTKVSFNPMMEHLLHSAEESPPTLESRNTPFYDFISKIAISNDQAEPFHPFAEPLPAQRIRYRVRFEGTSNYQRCKQRADELFYKEPCFLSTCSFNGVYLPRIAESRFLALGQYAKVRAALQIPMTATPDTLARRVSEVCALSWAELQTRQEAGGFQPFGKHGVAKLCWKAAWAHSTLTTGFGLEGESRAVTYFDFPLGPAEQDVVVSPGWALGSMLAEVTRFPWQNTRGRFETVFYWALASTTLLLGLTLLQKIKIRDLHKKKEALGALRSDIYHFMGSSAIDSRTN